MNESFCTHISRPGQMIAMEHVSLPPAPAPHAKQYVFVDEYNRHKRLKVMRACDGCRKRKIRCDGALQNGPWPCGACVRLKLKCVPPSFDQDNDSGSDTGESTTSTNQFMFQNTLLTSHPRSTSSPSRNNFTWATSANTPMTNTTAPTSAPSQQDEANYYSNAQTFHSQPVSSRLDLHYSEDDLYSSVSTPVQIQPRRPLGPGLIRTNTAASDSSCGDPEEVHSTVKELSSHMGDLRVEIDSTTSFIADHHKNATQTTSVDDVLLPVSVMSSTSVQIPPEMMPHEERAMDYFRYFFDFIHPYVPVLNKAKFYHQWHNERASIPPLILEAIFACVARYIEPSTETRRWLALAARHEESVKAVPRLSTVQALLLLMKAREFAPKDGYFYRSWMSLKYVITMAKDLGLHEHFDEHRDGNSTCTLDPNDCLVRTRIWQVLFILEIFIGGPQGRTDLIIDLDSVDFTTPFPASNLDASEYQVSRQYALLAKNVKNIRITHSMIKRRGRRHDNSWALDAKYSRHDANIEAYMKDLPSDMQLHYPDDGSPPWLGGDHFVAGVHLHYHLVVIMHHRPQLQAKLEKRDPGFKEHVDICAHSAFMMCRVHEALIRDFGLHGLLFMLRGINFTVYCVLTCAMLHLVAITSPDPMLNGQARSYFTRHMRVLEECIPTTSPDFQKQINTLREAFSLDTSKPFELKPTLGMKSPVSERQPTPPILPIPARSRSSVDAWSHLQVHSPASSSPTHEYGTGPFGSAGVDAITSHPNLSYSTTNYELSPNAGYSSQRFSQVSTTAADAEQPYSLEPILSNDQQPQQQTPAWDPSGIFNQWNSVFGHSAPPSQPSPPPGEPRLHLSGMTSSMITPSSQRTSPAVAGIYSAQISPTVTNVTPMMWQDAFTNAYISGHGRKRYRDDTVDVDLYEQYQPKRRL